MAFPGGPSFVIGISQSIAELPLFSGFAFQVMVFVLTRREAHAVRRGGRAEMRRRSERNAE
jgi:hypothetical protein